MVLPHKNTIKSYFGKLGSPGRMFTCKWTGKHCKILVDKIHIKPGAQYQGGHIIGYAEDYPSKLAKTVLELMVAPVMGKPAFIGLFLSIPLQRDFFMTR